MTSVGGGQQGCWVSPTIPHHRLPDDGTIRSFLSYNSGTSLRKLPLPIPPVEEQQEIIEALSASDEQLKTLRTHKTYLESLKAQAINRLLTGQHDAARGMVEREEVAV